MPPWGARRVAPNASESEAVMAEPIIIGGMMSGIFTPTEAAAIAAVAVVFDVAGFPIAFPPHDRASSCTVVCMLRPSPSSMGRKACVLVTGFDPFGGAMVNPSWAAVAMLGVGSTGIAYVLYFRLIARIGASRAITVTFLVPVFAMLWGAVFLGETVSVEMMLGGAVVLAGTALATDALRARRPG